MRNADIREIIEHFYQMEDHADQHDTWCTIRECTLLSLVYDVDNKLGTLSYTRRSSCRHCYHCLYCDASDEHIWQGVPLPYTFWRVLR